MVQRATCPQSDTYLIVRLVRALRQACSSCGVCRRQRSQRQGPPHQPQGISGPHHAENGLSVCSGTCAQAWTHADSGAGVPNGGGTWRREASRGAVSCSKAISIVYADGRRRAALPGQLLWCTNSRAKSSRDRGRLTICSHVDAMSCFRPFTTRRNSHRAADQEAAHTRNLLELLEKESRLKHDAQVALHYALTRNAVLVRAPTRAWGAS